MSVSAARSMFPSVDPMVEMVVAEPTLFSKPTPGSQHYSTTVTNAVITRRTVDLAKARIGPARMAQPSLCECHPALSSSMTKPMPFSQI